MLGPAAALGTASLVSFATRLEHKLRVPVVNLGRGGIGHVLAPLLSQSRAVVVVLMAGRSSANSAISQAALLDNSPLTYLLKKD